MERKVGKRRMMFALMILLLILAFVLTPSAPSTWAQEEQPKKTIRVAKFIVKGSNVTKDQLEQWDKEANEIWGCSLRFVTVGEIVEVDEPGDNKVAGAINVYGVPVNDDWYGLASDQDIIKVAQDAKFDTLAHEFGHFPGGNCTEADHVQNDITNLMYSGCARNGTKVTDEQQNRARHQADQWLQRANNLRVGNGNYSRDPEGDVIHPFIDITYTEYWATYNTLFLSILVKSFVNTSYSLGYLIESDSNNRTGEPPYGMDYMVYFDPIKNYVYFFEYADGIWVPLDSEGIIVKYLYVMLDIKVPEPTTSLQREIGVEFALPLSLLTRRDGDLVSLIAFSNYEAYSDASPDTGFSSIRYVKNNDIAILSVTPSKTVLGAGTKVSIWVIVWNKGNSSETFSVNLFYNASLMGTLPVTLTPGNETTLVFSWDTTGVAKGKYVISAYADSVPGEIEITDNVYIDGVISIELHDITIVNITPSKTVVGHGYHLNINITVANQGDYTETFNVTVYANETIIATLVDITLISRTSTAISSTWNTSGFAKGNYTISAYAWPVPGETDLGDNTFVDGWVIITIPGDVDGDFDVDIYDVVKICAVYGSNMGDANYVPNCDINCDGKINIYDVVIACVNYGKKYP